MPHNGVRITGGVIVNETPALNQTGLSSCNLIRTKPDPQGLTLVEKIGGWARFFSKPIVATVRAIWPWEDTNANKWLAFGTISQTSGPNSGQAQLGVLSTTTLSNGIVQGASLSDITPQFAADNVAVNVAIAFSGGAWSTTITDNTTTGITNFDSVYIANPISVGGIVLFGLYPCTGASSNTYIITPTDILGNALNPTYATLNGRSVNSGSSTGTAVQLSWASSISSTQVIPAGEIAQVAGTTNNGPTSWNGNFVVTACTTSSITFTVPGEGGGHSLTGSGTISTKGIVPLFTVTSSSCTVTVQFPDHGYAVGSTFPVLVQTTVGGVTLIGNYVVLSVPNSYTFTINGPQAAGSNASAYENAGNASYTYSIGSGPPTTGTGYGIGGYGIGGYGTGSTVVATNGVPIGATNWTLDNWGQQLIACPHGFYSSGSAPNGVQFQPIYYWDPTQAAASAQIIPQAPPVNAGCFVAMPQRQIVAYGSTFTGDLDPLLIRWCDVNNYGVWIGQITNQAGSFRLPRGSAIIGGMQTPQQGIIWTDIGAWAMQYIGPPLVYSFNQLGAGCGLIAQKAAGVLNGVVYWMGPNQFFSLTGEGVQPLVCPIWDVVYQQVDADDMSNIICAANSLFGEVTWYYPVASNSGTSLDGVPTNYVQYNTITNTWTFGTLSRWAASDVSVVGPPVLVGNNNVIYQHEIAPDADGSAINATFTTGYFALSDGDYEVFVDQFWPDLKYGYYGSVNNGASVQVTLNGVNYPEDTPYSYGPYTCTAQTEWFSPRVRARLMSITVSSSDTGTWWRVGLPRYRWQPDGRF